MAIRVLVVDEHPVVRQGVRGLLAGYPEIEIVGEADGGGQTLATIVALAPDVILLDLKVNGQDGLDLICRLDKERLSARVIVYTAHDDQASLLHAAQAGVSGYLLKTASAENLVDAICAVHSGDQRISASLADAAFCQLQNLARKQPRDEPRLTEQELRLLALIAEGRTVQDIAGALCQSERTIKRKTQEMLEKLGATNRAHAVAEAFRRGLL